MTEALAILGGISAVISIAGATKNIYDTAKDAEGLPKAFREVSSRLPIVASTLGHIKEEDIVEIGSGIEAIVINCHEKADKLQRMFRSALPKEGASKVEQYCKAVRILGKGHKVENLMKGILEDVQLLANEYAMRSVITDAERRELPKAIEEISAVPPSVLDDGSDTSNFMANYTGGFGGQRNAQGGTNHQGDGAQYNSGGGSMHFGCNHNIPSGKDVVAGARCTQPIFSTNPVSDLDQLQIQESSRGADVHQQGSRLTRKDKETLLLGVQLTPNPNFQGREDVLKLLDSYIRRSERRKSEQKIPSSCVLHGIGGVGKTQVALQYLYRYEDDYDNIFWVNSENALSIVEKFHDFAQALMPNQVSENQASSVDMMKRWLKQHQSWLVIFDNAEDLGIFSYLPSCQHGSVIITTQKMTLSQMASAEIHLDGLKEDDGCEVILKHIYHQRVSESNVADREVAKKISREVGGLPILLSQFAGFASHSHCNLVELLDLLQEPSSFQVLWDYDSRASTTFQYGLPMSKVWGLALQELSPEARQTLQLLTMLSPDGVPEAMLIGDWTEPDLAYLRPERKYGFFGVRQSLSSRHLVEINNSTGYCTSLSMHRSLRSHLIQLMSESAGSLLLQQNFDTAAVIVRRSFPPQTATQTPSNHNWNISKEYLPQILSLQSFYSSWKLRVQPSKTFASLLADAGMYLWEIGLRSGSITSLACGDQVCSSMGHRDDILSIHANICAIHGACLAEIGLSGRRLARVPVEKAFQLRKKQLQILTQSGTATRADHLLLANGWNDLGVLLMQNEEFEAARDCVQTSLVIKEEWITEEEEPAHFGETYKNLAYIRIHQNRNEEAVDLARRAYRLIENAYGPDAQATLKGTFVYGCILLATGDFETAKRIHKDTLTRRRRLLGDNSFITKDSIYVLGEIHRLSGRLDKAEKMFREMLHEADEAGCGKEAIARARYHLLIVLRSKTGDENIANGLSNEALLLHQQVQQYKQSLAKELTAKQLQEDELYIFDFVSSIWSGRPNLTGTYIFPHDPNLTTIGGLDLGSHDRHTSKTQVTYDRLGQLGHLER